MEKYNKIWEEIKLELENDLEEVVFADIFEPVNTIFKVVNNYIYIIAPNEFIKKRIEILYLNKINRYLKDKLDEVHKFKIMTQEQAGEELSD
ncbi:MAG: chromosomal replication initiator protein DnaA, partial [Candidatus Izimaplasma sp.]|nr:chromosomal replication initiator protein DnaA [Candidatus Izimaplasma bacterium]